MYANEKARQTVTTRVFRERVNTVHTHVETLLAVFLTPTNTHTHTKSCVYYLLHPLSGFKLGTLVTRSISNEFSA